MDHTYKERKPKEMGIATQLVAYATAIGASMIGMWSFMRKFFHDNMKRTGALDGAMKIRDELKDLKRGTPGFITQYLAIDERYGKEIKNTYKELNISFTDKLKMMSKYEMARVGSIGIAAAAFAMGAIYNIKKNRELERRIIDVENREADIQATQQR